MPQHSKENILAGRNAVDVYRADHAKLYDKPWHRGIPEEHTPLLNIMLKALKELGFNSLDEFFDANRELNKQIVEASYRIEGECDGCPGREKGCEPDCFVSKSEYDANMGRNCFPLRICQEEIFDNMTYFTDRHGLPKPDGSLIPTCKFRWVKVKEPDIDWRWH